MQPATPYLVKLPGRSGFYFQRKVPADLVEALGKRLWRWKAGNTLQEARKATVVGLAQTDEIIATYRGSVAPELLHNLSHNVIEGLQEDLEAQGLTPQDIWPRHSPEDAHRLVQIQSGQTIKTTDELLKLATRLKQLAKQTLKHWFDVLKALVKLTRTNDITAITEDHARKYRDHLLDNVAGTTAKTRLGYIKGLFNVAKDEQ